MYSVFRYMTVESISAPPEAKDPMTRSQNPLSSRRRQPNTPRQTVQRLVPPAMAPLLLAGAGEARADEQFFMFARGAETLPARRAELCQFVTFRTGKRDGRYHGFESDTEFEYGVSDRLQASVAVVNHYFHIRDVEELPDTDADRFGGVEMSAKYRMLSPFKDPLGVAIRVEAGYLWNDEVGGLTQHERFLAPELDLQRNFRDDTVAWNLNLGPEWAWGKQPAEQYPRELALQAATGAAFRFASNWFAGEETRVRSEWPLFDFGHFEHVALYIGPSVHYGGRRWWGTLTWLYQARGDGIDEPDDGQTFAEETSHLVRFKLGLNF
jgi:Family of unknown function (DUF6662)